jgi:hypothetical protein
LKTSDAVRVWMSSPRRNDSMIDSLAREMREDAQLDLRVVRGHERQPSCGHERGADPPPQLRADRDVHEVRVLRAEPPGRRHELIERRVDAAGPGIHEHGQRVRVRALQLGEAPVLEDLRGKLVAQTELREDDRRP